MKKKCAPIIFKKVAKTVSKLKKAKISTTMLKDDFYTIVTKDSKVEMRPIKSLYFKFEDNFLKIFMIATWPLHNIIKVLDRSIITLWRLLVGNNF